MIIDGLHSLGTHNNSPDKDFGFLVQFIVLGLSIGDTRFLPTEQYILHKYLNVRDIVIPDFYLHRLTDSPRLRIKPEIRRLSLS